MKLAARKLPDGLDRVRRTPDFTQETVPSALLQDHATKEGIWGLIQVESGKLVYRVTDPQRTPFATVLTSESEPGIVEPTIRHQVEHLGVVRFHVEFFRAPG